MQICTHISFAICINLGKLSFGGFLSYVMPLRALAPQQLITDLCQFFFSSRRPSALQQGWHIAAWWDTNSRPVCLRCKKRGYVTSHFAFLRSECIYDAYDDKIVARHSAALLEKLTLFRAWASALEVQKKTF